MSEYTKRLNEVSPEEYRCNNINLGVAYEVNPI